MNEMIECIQGKFNAKFRLITDEGPKLVCRICFGLMLDEKDDFIKAVLQDFSRNIKSKHLYIFFNLMQLTFHEFSYLFIS